jgi:hypothetical protein
MEPVFIGSEALREGRLTRHELQRWHRRVYPDVYAPGEAALSLRDRTVAAWLWSRRGAVIAGAAASALHGARWVDDHEPVELLWRNGRPPGGITVYRERVDADEVTRAVGLPVTTPARTAFDLGRMLPRDTAVARMDALMWATPFAKADVLRLMVRHAGVRGLQALRVALPLVDRGAASPKETWLRLLLVDAGFPTPETQIPVVDARGIVGALDMGWRRRMVAVEYDGDHHRSDRRIYVKDQRRLRRMEAAGWAVVRVIAEDRPADIVERVDCALTQASSRTFPA